MFISSGLGVRSTRFLSAKNRSNFESRTWHHWLQRDRTAKLPHRRVRHRMDRTPIRSQSWSQYTAHALNYICTADDDDISLKTATSSKSTKQRGAAAKYASAHSSIQWELHGSSWSTATRWLAKSQQ